MKREFNSYNLKHGLSRTRLYNVYRGMISRCYNEKDKYFYRYGGRGILVCEEWKNDIKAFYDWAINNGYAEGLTLDRKENNENYSPSNCRFATTKEQSRNKSMTVNLTFNGKTQCVTDWVKELGTTKNIIHYRIKRFGRELALQNLNAKYKSRKTQQ